MSDGLDIGQGVTIPLDEIELRASRSGGPGGQHANVTASRIEAGTRFSMSSVVRTTTGSTMIASASAPAQAEKWPTWTTTIW